MGKRRTREQIQRLLREADRDLARGLTVGDVCRKIGVSQNSFYRWRQRFDPSKVDDERRLRELQVEVENDSSCSSPSYCSTSGCFRTSQIKSGNARPAAGRG